MEIPAKDASAKDQIQKGSELHKAGDFRGALVEYGKALKIEPENSEAHRLSGDALFTLRRFQDAILEYQRTIGKDGQAASGHVGWGNCLVMLGKYKDGIEHFEEAAKLLPKWAYPHLGWAAALTCLGDSAGAAEKIRVAAGINPKIGETLKAWGNGLYREGKYGEALDMYREAFERGERNAQALNGWGICLSGLGKYEEAIEKFNEALDLDSNFILARTNWGGALLELGRYHDAAEEYEKATQIDEKNTTACHNLAYVFGRVGSYRPAHGMWQKAADAYRGRRTEGKPESLTEDFYYNYGNVVYESLGDLDEGERVYRVGLELNPDHVGILKRLGSLHSERRNKLRSEEPGNDGWMLEQSRAQRYFSQAKMAFERKLREKQDPEVMVQFAELLLVMGEAGNAESPKYSSAEKYLLDAVDLLKTVRQRSAARNDLGLVYFRREEFGRAVRCYEGALRLDPGDFSVWSNLAEACLKAGQTDRALSEYLNILKLAPEHLDSVIGLGDVYLTMADGGDKDLYHEALNQFHKAIGLAPEPFASKRLKPKDLAAIYYSRGYARVKCHEFSGPFAEQTLLDEAYKDFEQCRRLDNFHAKAAVAIRKLDQRRKWNSPQRGLEKWGGSTIFAGGLYLFVFANVMLRHHPNQLAELIAMMFGGLVFSLAGISLPRLLKLKVAGLELERSQTEQITTSSQLGITRWGGGSVPTTLT